MPINPNIDRLHLRALKAPDFVTNSPIFENRRAAERAVQFLEDRVIRHHKITERGYLRTVDGAFETALQKYLLELGAPVAKMAIIYTDTQKYSEDCVPLWMQHALSWIIAYAVSTAFYDSPTTFNRSAASLLKQDVASAIKTQDKNDVDELLGVLNLVSSGNEEDDLRKALKTLKKNYSKSHISEKVKTKGYQSRHPQNTFNIQPKKIEDFPLGFHISHVKKKGVLNDTCLELQQAATLLRMIYVEDLEILQTEINKLIVIAQEFTANPRTDSRLGRSRGGAVTLAKNKFKNRIQQANTVKRTKHKQQPKKKHKNLKQTKRGRRKSG